MPKRVPLLIKVRFRRNDIIWYMRSNSPVQGQIDRIDITIKDKHISIQYSGNWVGTQWRFSEYENSVFATKQELLNSL